MIKNFYDSKYILRSLRPRHWTKNIIVFAAPLFSFHFYNLEDLLYTFFAFILFSLSSSSIYLLNDCLDIEADRNHPIKKLRPIPSGLVSVKKAISISISLSLLCIISSFLLNKFLGILIISYLIIQTLYCIRLKKEPLLDLFCLSAGFLLRATAGGIASNLYISPWFLLTTGLLSLFLAVEKRKAELKNSIAIGEIKREVLKRYSFPLLLRIESLVSTGAFISYMLWASGPNLNGSSSSLMLLTVPFVLLGIFRYQLLSDPEELIRRKNINPNCTTENPEEILLRDKGIKLIVICWLILTIGIGIIT